MPDYIKGGKLPDHEREQRRREALASVGKVEPVPMLADGGLIKVRPHTFGGEPRNRAERRAAAKASACRHRNVQRRRFIDRTTLTCTDCGDLLDHAPDVE